MRPLNSYKWVKVGNVINNATEKLSSHHNFIPKIMHEAKKLYQFVSVATNDNKRHIRPI